MQPEGVSWAQIAQGGFSQNFLVRRILVWSPLQMSAIDPIHEV